MPLLPALGGGLAIGQGVFQGLLGLTQLFRGNRMKPQRPTYEISPEAQAGLAQRQSMLNARAPGAVQAEQNIYQSQAAAQNNQMQAATDAQTLLASAGASQGTTNRALNQLRTAEQQDYYQRLAGLEAQQANMTQQRDKAFQVNEMQPFIDATNTKAGLIEGGLSNIYGAMGDTSATLGKAYLAQQGQGGLGGPIGQAMSGNIMPTPNINFNDGRVSTPEQTMLNRLMMSLGGGMTSGYGTGIGSFFNPYK